MNESLLMLEYSDACYGSKSVRVWMMRLRGTEVLIPEGRMLVGFEMGGAMGMWT